MTTPDGLAGQPIDEAPARALIEVRDLTVTFPTPRGTIRPVAKVSFAVTHARTLGIVGESGSGKSMTLRAVLDLVPPPGRIDQGEVVFAGRDLLRLSESDRRSIRGREIGIIFQDPMASLNPVLTVGDQLSELLRAKAGLGRKAAWARAGELLDRVGIRSATSRLRSYPHQFSGGMAQRVMIAMAIGAGPRLLLADEPTTALDVSVQDQVLALLEDLRLETTMSMIIVSHDIGVIARACDDVAVMYAGMLLERGAVSDVLRRPRHPYTKMLLSTVPTLEPNVSRRRLETIVGQLPDLATLTHGCPFAPRCAFARPECDALDIALDMDPHASACPFV
jgi:peptide/nickel transport system ATP-binding protein